MAGFFRSLVKEIHTVLFLFGGNKENIRGKIEKGKPRFKKKRKNETEMKTLWLCNVDPLKYVKEKWNGKIVTMFFFYVLINKHK